MSAHINLLDWREARRERRKQHFFTILGASALGAVLVMLLVSMFFSHQIDQQNARNSYLQQQINDINQQIKEIAQLEKLKGNLLSRMRIIERLQTSRSATVHFFDEIVNTLPDGVYLTSIKQAGNMVTLTGVAQSNGRVSTYMNNLNASPWFDNPELVVIKTTTKNHERYADFTLRVKNLTDSVNQSGGRP